MLANVTAWASQPFAEDMNLGKWCLFLVVMVTVAVLWLQVLHLLSDEV